MPPYVTTAEIRHFRGSFLYVTLAYVGNSSNNGGQDAIDIDALCNDDEGDLI